MMMMFLDRHFQNVGLAAFPCKRFKKDCERVVWSPPAPWTPPTRRPRARDSLSCPSYGRRSIDGVGKIRKMSEVDFGHKNFCPGALFFSLELLVESSCNLPADFRVILRDPRNHFFRIESGSVFISFLAFFPSEFLDRFFVVAVFFSQHDDHISKITTVNATPEWVLYDSL